MGQVVSSGIHGTACLDLSGFSGAQTVLTLLGLLELPRTLAGASTPEVIERGGQYTQPPCVPGYFGLLYIGAPAVDRILYKMLGP